MLGAVSAPELRGAAEAVGNALGERSLFYRPGQAEALNVTVVTQAPANNKSPADLLAIKINGFDTMTILETDESFRFTTLLGQPTGETDIQIGALLEVLTRYHLLPKQLIQSETNADMIVRVPEFAGVEIDV